MSARRMLKRGAKWTVEWGTRLSGLGLLYRHTSYFRSAFRILTYHRIAAREIDSYTVKLSHFRSHMETLAGEYHVLDLDSALSMIEQGSDVPPGSVAVTFDDGYTEMAGPVAEILDSHRIPATFFIITGALDRPGEMRGGPFMSWDQVKQLAAAGFSIGSHTVSHRSLGEISPEEVRTELEASRRRLTEELGTPIRGLSYPYGTRRDFSTDVMAAAREAGYSWAVTAIHSVNQPETDRFALKRTSMSEGDGPTTFRMIMRGNLDAWALVDRWAYRLQRPFETGLGKNAP